jgi:hypothetical protein
MPPETIILGKHIAGCLLRGRIAKPAETAAARQWLSDCDVTQ